MSVFPHLIKCSGIGSGSVSACETTEVYGGCALSVNCEGGGSRASSSSLVRVWVSTVLTDGLDMVGWIGYWIGC